MEEVVPVKIKKPSNALSPSRKDEVLLLCRRGELTTEEIGSRYGKSARTIKRMMENANIRYGEASDDVRREVEKAMEDETKRRAAELVQRISSAKEDHFKIATIYIKTLGKIIVETAQKHKAIGGHSNDIRTIHMALAALKNGQSVVHTALGIDKDNGDGVGPEILTIAEMTADQIKEVQRKRNADSIGDAALDETLEKLSTQLKGKADEQ